MTHGASQIRALLDDNGLAPSRALGQNFVIDPNTVRRIAAMAGVEPGTNVLEIGAGLGSLTLALAELGAEVTAVEIDRHLVPVLEFQVVGVKPPIRVVHADALDVDLDELLAPADEWRLAANLPYNVGTTILLRILEHAPKITGGIVLVQREVADRLVASVGNKIYGIPSVKAAWFAELTMAGKVPATVFHPKPNVDSALVRIERRDAPGDEATRQRVFGLVDRGFGQRRKMLRRSLQEFLTAEDIEAAGVAPTARAEELTLAQWVDLAHALAAVEGAT